MFTTLQNTEHTVHTAYSDSQHSYGGDLWLVPMQGVLQGNGAGPMLRAVVSTPVLNVMHAKDFGTYFCACISDEEIRFVGYSFVDDTDLIQMAKETNESELSVATSMQQALNTWEGCIRTIGGTIVPSKSFWYLISFNGNE